MTIETLHKCQKKGALTGPDFLPIHKFILISFLPIPGKTVPGKFP